MRIDKKRLIISIIIGIFCSISLFGVLYTKEKISFGVMIEQYANTDQFSIYHNEKIELEPEQLVTQEFVSKRGNLYSFALKFNSEAFDEYAIVDISLRDIDTQNEIQKWNVNAEQIEWDGFVEFELNERLNDAYGKKLAIDITTVSDGVLLEGMSHATSTVGDLYFDGELLDTDLAIKLSSERVVYNTLVYAVLCCLMLGIVISIVYYFRLWKKAKNKIELFCKLIIDNKRELLVAMLLCAACGAISFIVGLGSEKAAAVLLGVELEFNIFRALFFAVCLLVATALVKYRALLSAAPEKLFLMVFLVIGAMYIIAIPSLAEISWDAAIHYWNAVGVSHATSGKANLAESWLYWHSGTGYIVGGIQNLINSYANVQQIYNSGIMVSSNTDILNDLMMIAYIPSAVGLFIGRLLHLPYAITYYMGAVMNLIVYITAFYFAIKRVKSGKMIMIAVAGIPVSMFLASVYSYDSWITAFVALGFGYYLGCMQDGMIQKKDMWVMLIAFSLAFVPKPVYFPLFLLFVFIPERMFESHKECIGFKITSVALCGTFLLGVIIRDLYLILLFPIVWGVVYCLTWLILRLNKKQRIFVISLAGIVGVVLVWAAVYKVLPSIIGTGDSRGGSGVNSAEQVMFILNNPLEYCGILFGFLKNEYLSFRAELQSLFNLFGYIGESKYHVVNFIFLWLVAFTDKNYKDKWKGYGWSRGLYLVIGLITICIIATALYVSFTSVASDTISGCQVRYLMPLVLPFYTLIGSNRFNNKISLQIYNGSVFIITSGLLLLSLWDVVIKNYV